MSKPPGKITRVAISITSATTTEVAPAADEVRWRVMNYVLVSSGTNTFQWKSATTNLSGAMPVGQNTGAAASDSSPFSLGLIETAAGEALNLTTTQGVNLMGHCTLLRLDANSP